MKAWFCIGGLALSLPLAAGPYSMGLDDPDHVFDAPVPGFTGPHGIGKARLDDGFGGFSNPSNYVNPIFFAWANGYQNYQRSDNDLGFSDPTYALGPVTGDEFDVVSLGDMTATEIANGNLPGRITLTFVKPIRNRSGADFVVFENGFISGFSTSGQVFAELAHVEVSADGVTFHRFPSVSITSASVGSYGAIHPTNVFNLAGKHVNANGESWGTPFDIGQLGLEQITHIRVIDIPGNGAFTDSLGNPIYDSWQTIGSGGFDLEAVGAISVDMSYAQWPALAKLPPGQRGPMDDPDNDGIPNLLEYAFGLVPWESDPPSSGWGFSWVTDSGNSYPELTTRRDERLVDLIREVQISNNLSSWETIAISTAGAPFEAVGDHELNISEEREGGIASVGVIRRDVIRDLTPTQIATRRFYQLKVRQISP